VEREQENTMQTNRRGIIALASLIPCVITAGLCFGVFGCSRQPKVDFTKVSPERETTAAGEQPVLRVAVAAMISPSITKQYYEDLLKLVGTKAGRRVEFIQRKSYAEVNDLIEKREVDLAFVCSGPYVLGHAKFGMEILVVPVVDGNKVYHSYIIAKKTSSLSSFDDLKGKKFAFTDPDSNTGCLVPRFMLSRRGTTPETFFQETFYTHSHDNSIKAVAEGLADGAAVDSLIWEFMNATDATFTSQTKIIEKSPPYGIPPVVVHASLDPALKQSLKAILLALHDDPTGRGLLQHLRIERFEEGGDELYQTVREMQEWLAKPNNR
jgi:phosphonate transport system substrate-binding protein